MAGIDPSTVWDFAGEIVGTISNARAKAVGTVTRIDTDGTAWVSVGGSAEAPAASAIASVAVGDSVTVEWSGTQMTITGNSTDPPSSTATLEKLAASVGKLRDVAEATRRRAAELAGYVWHDSSGVHLGRADNTPDDIEIRGFNDYGDGNARIRIKDGDSIALEVVDTYQGFDNFLGLIWLHWTTAHSEVLELVFDTLRFANTYITKAELLQALTTATDSIDLNEGVSATTHAVKRSGGVVTVSLATLKLASALSSGSTTMVGTVPSGYRPPNVVYAHLAGYQNGGSYVTVDASGYVEVHNYSGASIPTTRNLGATVTYCI